MCFLPQEHHIKDALARETAEDRQLRGRLGGSLWEQHLPTMSNTITNLQNYKKVRRRRKGRRMDRKRKRRRERSNQKQDS